MFGLSDLAVASMYRQAMRREQEWEKRVNMRPIGKGSGHRPPSLALQLFESAGSRPVIGDEAVVYPRTRRPDRYTAKCPHKDCEEWGIIS